MRMVKLLIILTVLGGLGLMATRSVSVDSDADQVRITINRQKLRQAGSELTNQGRRAVGRVGQALEQAGETSDDEAVAAEKKSVLEKLFSR
jgi:hypothetical protein